MWQRRRECSPRRKNATCTRMNGMCQEEETRKTDVCDVKKFCTFDSSEETIVILGDKWWPQAAKEEGHEMSKNLYLVCDIYRKILSAPILEASLFGVGAVPCLETDAWSVVKLRRKATNENHPPPPTPLLPTLPLACFVLSVVRCLLSFPLRWFLFSFRFPLFCSLGTV